VAQLVAGPVRETSPRSGVREHLVETLRRQRVAAGGSLQRHEHPVRRRGRRALAVDVAGDRREERLRHRHQPLTAALALRDGHPPLAQPEILEPQAEHLATAQPAQQHRLDDGPIAFGAKRRHQRLDLRRLQDARQPANPSHQRHHAALAAMSALPSRQASRHGVDRHVAAGDEIAIEARHRRQPPLDRRRRQPRSAVGDAHDLLRARPGPLLSSHEVQDVPRRHLRRRLAHHGEERLQIMRIRPHRARPGPPESELQELVDLVVTDTPRPVAIGAHHTPERRGPHHRTHLLIGPTPTRGGSSGGQPRRWITRVSAVLGARGSGSAAGPGSAPGAGTDLGQLSPVTWNRSRSVSASLSAANRESCARVRASSTWWRRRSSPMGSGRRSSVANSLASAGCPDR